MKLKTVVPYLVAGAFCLGVGLHASPLAEKHILLEENFDDVAVGSMPTGWSGDLEIKTAADSQNRTQYLSGARPPQGTRGVLKAKAALRLAPQNGPFALSFRMRTFSDRTATEFLILGNGEGQCVQVLSVNGTLRIVPVPGLQYSFFASKKTVWKHLRMSFDPTRQDLNCRIDIDGAPKAIYPLPRLYQQAIDRLNFGPLAAIDDLKIESGPGCFTLPPEPERYITLIPGIAREKRTPEGGETVPNDIFKPFLTDRAPEIVRTLSEETVAGVQVREVVYKSLLIDGQPQEVYAIVSRPAASGRYPGLLVLHGGGGGGDRKTAVRWASRGYIAVVPDLPGIGNPQKCRNSKGLWRLMPYSTSRWYAAPDARVSGLYEGVIAGLQSFFLLQSQPDVITDKIGITGVSWGGYMTTMLSGLLGRRPAAAFAIYGCGSFDRGSVFLGGMSRMKGGEREVWLRELDAGRQAAKIQVPMYFAASAVDFFFWPPAVCATYASIPGEKNLILAPKKSHSLAGIEGNAQLQHKYFNHYLKGEGPQPPQVEAVHLTSRSDGRIQVDFNVKTTVPLKTARVFYSAKTSDWRKRKWQAVEAVRGADGACRGLLPDDVADGNCYVVATDTNLMSGGSVVFNCTAPFGPIAR
jgi:dienelactone hydrolase